MNKIRHKRVDVGPWVKEKLDTLGEYLDYYTQVLKNQKFDRIYIDAFAGTPKAKIRQKTIESSEEQYTLFEDDPEYFPVREEYIKGSPLVALDAKNGFHHHYFYDLDKSRAGSLSNACGDRKDVTVEVGECNELIRSLAPRLTKANNIRGVAFLDPYGPHVEWKTVEALADVRTMEVIINFPLNMAINRLITKQPDASRESWINLLNKCFGTPAWRELCYFDEELMDETVTRKRSDATQRMLEFYQRRLKEKFKHVATPHPVRNTRGVPIYYLIWAGQDKMGLKGAEYILTKDKRKPKGSGESKQGKLL